jgi:hypothetical protein
MPTLIGPRECRVIPPQGRGACGKAATHRATFASSGGEGDEVSKVACCLECGLHLQEQASAHRTTVVLEKI